MATGKMPVKIPARVRPKVRGKKEIIEIVAREARITTKQAQLALKALLDTIKDSLKKGTTVRLIPFGNFEVRQRAGRTGRNPRTGVSIDIPPRKIPAFRPGKDLRDAVK